MRALLNAFFALDECHSEVPQHRLVAFLLLQIVEHNEKLAEVIFTESHDLHQDRVKQVNVPILRQEVHGEDVERADVLRQWRTLREAHEFQAFVERTVPVVIRHKVVQAVDTLAWQACSEQGIGFELMLDLFIALLPQKDVQVVRVGHAELGLGHSGIRVLIQEVDSDVFTVYRQVSAGFREILLICLLTVLLAD